MPPPAATGATLRWARLLSNGISRQCAVGPNAQGKPPDASIFDRSPGQETSMSMHSCPASVGTQVNGPTTTDEPTATSGEPSCGVDIGDQSSGQVSPTD